MQARLHQEIVQHDSKALITVDELKLSINDLHSWGLSALQVAAREGQWQVCVKLLSLNASIDQVRETAADNAAVNPPNSYFANQSSKTPLYLAVEYGHTLLAQILLACGANKELALNIAHDSNDLQMQHRLAHLALDTDVAFGLAFYAMNKNNDGVLKKVLEQLDEGHANILAISALLEAALALPAEKAVEVLLERANGRALREDPSIYSAGYWASQYAEDFLKRVCLSTSDWVTTLSQLRATQRPVKSCFDAAPLAAKNAYIAKQQFAGVHIQQQPSLTLEQNAAYADLAHAKRLEVELYCETTEDFAAIAKAAWENKNLIILTSLQKHFNQGLHRAFIESDHKALAQFWFLSEEKYFHEVALDLEGESDLLLNATRFFGSQQSLLHELVGRSMDLKTRPEQVMVEFAARVAVDDDAMVSTLQICVQDRYSIASINLEAEESKEEEKSSYDSNPFFKLLEPPSDNKLSPFKINVSLSDPLTPHDLSIVSVCFNRFGVGINKDEHQASLEQSAARQRRRKNKVAPFKDLSSHLWVNYIVPSLNSKDLKSLASVSHYTHEYKLAAEPHFDARWIAHDERFIASSRREERLNRFLNEAESINRLLEAMQAGLDEKSFLDEREVCFPTTVMLISSGFTLLAIYGLIYYNAAIADDYTAINLTQSCAATNACNVYNECIELCESRDLHATAFALSLLGGIFSLTFLLSSFIMLMENCFAGQQRFDDMPLSDVCADALVELREVKSSQPDPLPILQANSPVGYVRQIATEVRSNRLRGAARIQAEIEIEKRDEVIERERV
jgi:hypothetical protein